MGIGTEAEDKKPLKRALFILRMVSVKRKKRKLSQLYVFLI